MVEVPVKCVNSKDLPQAKVGTAGFYGVCVMAKREMPAAAALW